MTAGGRFGECQCPAALVVENGPGPKREIGDEQQVWKGPSPLLS